jgi:hypothetical protein
MSHGRQLSKYALTQNVNIRFYAETLIRNTASRDAKSDITARRMSKNYATAADAITPTIKRRLAKETTPDITVFAECFSKCSKF